MLVTVVFVDFVSHMATRWLSYDRLSVLAIPNSKEIPAREPQDIRRLRPDLSLDFDTATRKLGFLTCDYAVIESNQKLNSDSSI
jgi:hypothetical protein